MKTCRKCGNRKPDGEFYRHPKNPDGLMRKCKECHKAYMRRRHREKMQDPTWREAERERSRQKYRERGHLWESVDPEQRAAHVAVSNAVRDGRLIPPDQCEDCGHDFGEFRREAHHEDYGKPLDVNWLCALCHGKRHRQEEAA